MVVSDHSLMPLDQLMSYKGRQVAVTGGAEGIGAAIVGRMAEAGANVMIGDINLVLAKETARHMGARFGVICQANELNVTDARSISDFCDAPRRILGGIDVWVNNAGLFPWSLLLDTEEATWDDGIAVNMKGVFLCTQAAGRLMIACKPDQGVIINIASMFAFRAKKGLGVYAAAKHGVVGLTPGICARTCRTPHTRYGSRPGKHRSTRRGKDAGTRVPSRGAFRHSARSWGLSR